MADYYVDTSQTFNGDGTASTSAASAGAVGAANSFIEVMKGLHSTIGSLAAGSNVYVRTHDGTNDCNETITVDTDFSTSASIDNPIDIYFDDGTVWAGDSGQYTIKNATDSVDLQISRYLNLHGGDSSDRRFKYEVSHTNSNSNSTHLILLSYVCIYGLEYEASTALSASKISVNGVNIVVADLYFNYSTTKQWYPNFPTIAGGNSSGYTFINPVFNIPTIADTTSSGIFIFTHNYGGVINIIGGKIIGGRSTIPLFENNITSDGSMSMMVNVTGFDLGTGGSTLINEADFETRSLSDRYQFNAIGVGGGLSYLGINQGCIIKFDDNGSYPTLNSSLPDSANTKWAYLVKLHTTVGGNYRAILPPINKYYSDTSGTKTITAHLIVDSTHSPTKNNFWMEVGYIDNSTGVYTTESTRIDESTTVLDADSADWSTSSYPGFLGVKRKIELSANIRQDTVVKVSLFTTMSNPSTTTVLFYDPDVEFV